MSTLLFRTFNSSSDVQRAGMSATSLYSRFDLVYFTLPLPPRVLVLHVGVVEGPSGLARFRGQMCAEGFAGSLGKGRNFSLRSTIAHS